MALTPYSISRLYAKNPIALAGFGEAKIKPPPKVISFCPDQRVFFTSLETKYLEERIKNYSKPKNNVHPSISTANYFLRSGSWLG
jgi:hypothetical protein